MKEVSIVAATFYGNRGAEGMLSTTIGQLREQYPESLHFNAFTYYPERDRQLVVDRQVDMYSSTPAYLVLVLFPGAILYRLFGIPGLSYFRRFLPGSVRALARSKALICLAGVSFVSGREKFIPFNVATILPALVLGVPVVKFAQAMGPFESAVNRFSAKFFLGRCRKIFTRGEVTHAHLKELFPEGPLFQRADDIAFLFKRDFCLSKPAEEFVDQESKLIALRQYQRPIVGVCPSVVIASRAKLAGWDYTQRMVELVEGLIKKGYSVVLYPNATRGSDMDKTHNNDLPLLDSIFERLDEKAADYVVKFSGSLNAEQIHRVINACDVQAVSRFHAMVASLASGVPVMVIGWSHKYLEVMERFGQEDMVFDYKKGNIEPVIVCIDRLVFERSERSELINQALPSVRDLSGTQVNYLVDLLKSA